MPTLDDFLVRVAALAPFAENMPYLSLVMEPDDPIAVWAREQGFTLHPPDARAAYDVMHAGVQIRIIVNRMVG